MILTQTQLQARNWYMAQAALAAKIATVSADDIAALKTAGILDANNNYLPPLPSKLVINIGS